MNINVTVSTSGNGPVVAVRLALAAIGAGCVVAAYVAIMSVASVFTAVLPYVGGALLFATLIGSFYFLMGLFKDMRQHTRFRVSFWDGYTALAVFTVMGYMATACMHAFLSTGNPLELWNSGSMAAGLFTVFYGLARFCGDLWKN